MNAGLAVKGCIAVIGLNPATVKVKLRRGTMLAVSSVKTGKLHFAGRAERKAAQIANQIREHAARFSVTVGRV